jgi:hypothetical protein
MDDPRAKLELFQALMRIFDALAEALGKPSPSPPAQ